MLKKDWVILIKKKAENIMSYLNRCHNLLLWHGAVRDSDTNFNVCKVDWIIDVFVFTGLAMVGGAIL